MKKTFGGMTLAALLLLASPSAKADNAFVGDLSTADTYSSAVAPIPNYAPITVGDLQPAGFRSSASCDSGCDVGCDGGCDSGCDGGCDGRVASRMREVFNMCETDGWIRSEAMVAFFQNRTSPVLVTTSDPGTFPAFPPTGSATTVAAFGGDDALDGGVSAGFRGDIGRYVSDGWGLGGRFLWISDNGDTYSNSGTGAAGERSIGRPFFDLNLAQTDALEVNQAGLFAGSVDARFETQLYGAEAYARMRFCKNKASRLEFIGGYSYFNLDDMLQIRSVTRDLGTNTITTTQSLFDAENEFNGGQIGFDSLITRGRWSARTLVKVHLGNVQQTVNVSGTTDQVTPPAPPAAQTNSSLLVTEAQGTATNDEFTFIPELNFSMGYRFRDYVSFRVGYNFMYFDSVALAGEQINAVNDRTNLFPNVTPTGITITDGSLWVQSVTFGTSIDY